MSNSTEADKFAIWFPVLFLVHPKRLLKRPAQTEGPNGERCVLLFTDVDLAETLRDGISILEGFLVRESRDATEFLESLDVFEKGGLTHAVIDFDGKHAGRFHTLAEIRSAVIESQDD